MRFLVLLLFIASNLNAQIVQNVEVELVGRPSWQNLIPLAEDGLLMLSKTDQTKAKIIKFDKDLNKAWETDFFLDVERSPTAYTVDNEFVTFLFRETSGMYYQVFIFDLKTGKFQNKGFELRDFFDDQSYVFLKNKVLMAGATQKGGAFYEYDFESESGKLIDIDLPGKVRVQEFMFNPKLKKIESLWAVKTLGYTNEKQKKGEFTKDAFLAQIDFDTLGKALKVQKFGQKSGNFPISGKFIKSGKNENEIVGTYQSNSGDRGLFYLSNIGKSVNINFYSFSVLLKKSPEVSTVNFSKQIKNLQFLMNEPLKNETGVTIGGVFFEMVNGPVSQQTNNPNSTSPKFSLFGNTNSRSQTIVSGFQYINAFVANFSSSGELLISNRVDINQVSSTLRPTMSFNNMGAVAYCVKGNLAAKNFNIGTKPILYKLSDETINTQNQVYLPSYQEVRFWYDNYFIANGSKSKIEVLKLEKNTKSPSNKKKKNKPSTFTQVRKTIYLTKIASGVAGQ